MEDENLESDGEIYWAAKGPDELLDECRSRVEEFWRDGEQATFSEQISRNWAYYHNQFRVEAGFNILGVGGIQRMGPQGEKAFLGIGNFRNLLRHFHELVTRDTPAPKAVPINSSHEAMADAQVVDAVVQEYLNDKGLRQQFARAQEQSNVVTVGLVTLDWDESLGEEQDADIDAGTRLYAGDVRVGNPTIWDLVKDRENRKPLREHHWCMVREWVNRWDLAARFPEKRREILDAQEPDETLYFSRSDRRGKGDLVGLWTFWHKKSPALQTGRKFTFVNGAWLENGPLPEYFAEIPVYETCPAEAMFCGEGYSPGFDLQGPQQALNGTVSSLLTNLDALGVQSIWSPPGNTITAGQIAKGLRLLQCKVKPEPIQLTANPKDAYTFVETMNKMMELLSGIDSVTRGQPESTLKSGKALSIVESKAIQFANGAITNYFSLVERFCTALVRLLAFKLEEGNPRVVRIAGPFNTMLQKDYGTKQLRAVERIRVEAGNPLQRTVSGRFDLAEFFVSQGWVKTPEEAMSVFLTGRLEPIYQADQAMLAGLTAERDALLAGKVVPVLKTDYHSLHIREAAALLNTPEVRLNNQLAAVILGHVLTHTAMLYLPDVRDLQIAQGYQVPPLSPMIPPGLLESIPGEYQDSFNMVDRTFFATPTLAAPVGPAQPPDQPENGPPKKPNRPSSMGPSPLESRPAEETQ